MSEIWTMTGQTGKALNSTARTLSQMGAENAKMVFRNLAADTLSWSVPLLDLTPSSELIPELGQKVTLLRSGSNFFSGTVTKVRQRGRIMDMEVSGPWWVLERVFLQATITDGTGANGERATYALPKQSLTTSLQSLLDAAISLGCDFSVGTLATTFSCPEIKLNQMSFAQAISEVIRMTPDMVLYFNYANTTPSCQTRRRLTGLTAGSAGTRTLDAGDMEAFELNPLTELEVTQVKVPYLDRAANGAKQFKMQSSGTATLGKVQILTVSGDEMDTFLPKDLLDSVKVKTLPWYAISAAYIIKNDSTLANIQASIGGVFGGPGTYYERYVGNSKAKTYIRADVPGLSIRAVSGQSIPTGTVNLVTSTAPLPDWAKKSLGAIEVVISGTWIAAWRDSFVGVGVGWSNTFMAMQAGAQTQNNGWENSIPEPFSEWNYRVDWLARPFEVRGYVINTAYAALTTLYKPSDYDFISPASGFAAGLLAAQNYIPYEGIVTWMDEECGTSRHINTAVNLTSASPAHASMRAMVTAEELDLETGTTTLVLGAPQRFSYLEVVNKLRGSSTNNIIYL